MLSSWNAFIVCYYKGSVQNPGPAEHTQNMLPVYENVISTFTTIAFTLLMLFYFTEFSNGRFFFFQKKKVQ